MSPHTPQPSPEPRPNRGWDALKVIFQNCAAYTIAPSSLTPFINNADLTAKIADQTKLLQLANLLKRDVSEFASRLQAIFAKHKDREGNVTNGDQLMEVLQLQEEYIQWATSYEAVVIPTITAILDLYAAVGADTSGARPESPVDAAQPTAQE